MVHALVRERIAFVDEDRGLHPEIERLGERILAGELAAAAEPVLSA